MPYKDKQQVEFITIPFPKGTKEKLRKYAFKNNHRNISEVVRKAIEMLLAETLPSG